MAEQRLDILIRAKNLAAGAFRQLQDQLKDTKAIAGEASALGEFGKILRGGGAIAGLAAVIAAVAASFSTLAKAINSWRDGTDEWTKFLNETGRGIPILGWLAGGIVDATDAMVGYSRETKRLNDIAAENNKRLDEQKKRMEDMAAATRAAEETAWDWQSVAMGGTDQQLRNIYKAAIDALDVEQERYKKGLVNYETYQKAVTAILAGEEKQRQDVLRKSEEEMQKRRDERAARVRSVMDTISSPSTLAADILAELMGGESATGGGMAGTRAVSLGRQYTGYSESFARTAEAEQLQLARESARDISKIAQFADFAAQAIRDARSRNITPYLLGGY